MNSDVTINVTVTQGGDITADLSNGTVINTSVEEGGQIAAEIVGGAKGDKGDTGNTGATGATGAKGDKGDTGDAGVVQAVIAGANIDVDATDPANPIVSVENLVLADITNITATATEVNYTAGVTSAIQTQLNNKQPLDADLTTIAALDSSTAGAMTTDGAGWIRKTYAQLKTAMSFVKGDVGLGNVDNTSDANKPVSTAQATAIAVVQTDIDTHEANTSNPHSVTKSQVGLANADNTSDANKPISTATQTALDAKVAGPASVTDDLPAIFDGTTGKLIKSKTYAAFKTLLSLVKGDVGLGNVDNTSDVNKPVSTAQAAADAAVQAASQPLDSDLTTIAGLTATTDNFMVATASAWASRTPTQARSQMGLGSIALLSTITEANITLADNTTNDVTTARHGFVPKATNTGKFLKDDGTWASIPGGGDMLVSTYDPATVAEQLVGLTATQTLTNKRLTSPKINENVAVTATATELNYSVGVTSAIQTQLSNKQPLDSDLTTIAGLTATTDNFMQAKGSAWASRTPAQVLADLAAVGTTFQPLDSDLTTIAGLTATTDNFIVSVSSAWASRTPAQVKTTLSLNNVDNTSDATKNAAVASLTNKTFDSTSPTAFMFPGFIMPYAGTTTPSTNDWKLCEGSAISRTTFANLFAAIVPVIGTFTTTIATPGVMTLTAHGLLTGDQVYLTTTGALPTGLSANTLYYIVKIDANSFNLATTRANAVAGTKIATSGTQSGVHTLRSCPYGLGDGSTTFNVPDFRGRTLAGADGMGGTAAGRLNLADALGSYGNLGATGGEQRHTMTSGELVAHGHTITHNAYNLSLSSGGGGTSYNFLSLSSGMVNQNLSITAANSGSTTPFNLISPTAVVNYLIKT